MSCNCKVCQYGRKVQQHLNEVPQEQREFFDDMYQRLCMAEMDRDVNQMVIDGTWPSADETIFSARAPQIPNNIHFLSYNTFDIIP